MKKRPFTVTEYRVKATQPSRMGRGAAPIRAALISDTHGRSIPGLVEAVAEASPDLILVPGDAIENKRPGHHEGIPLLSALASVAPLFFSSGNHERELSAEQLRGLEHAGVHRVDLHTEQLEVRGECIRIGGVPSASYENGELCQTTLSGLLFPPKALSVLPERTAEYIRRFAREDGVKLLLCHHPEYYERYLRNQNTGIVCSGHAHGGQIRLLGHGLYAPGQGFLPRYTSGVHDGRFVISRGLTNHSFPPRIFNRPELVILNIYLNTDR